MIAHLVGVILEMHLFKIFAGLQTPDFLSGVYAMVLVNHGKGIIFAAFMY